MNILNRVIRNILNTPKGEGLIPDRYPSIGTKEKFHRYPQWAKKVDTKFNNTIEQKAPAVLGFFVQRGARYFGKDYRGFDDAYATRNMTPYQKQLFTQGRQAGASFDAVGDIVTAAGLAKTGQQSFNNTLQSRLNDSYFEGMGIGRIKKDRFGKPIIISTRDSVHPYDPKKVAATNLITRDIIDSHDLYTRDRVGVMNFFKKRGLGVDNEIKMYDKFVNFNRGDQHSGSKELVSNKKGQAYFSNIKNKVAGKSIDFYFSKVMKSGDIWGYAENKWNMQAMLNFANTNTSPDIYRTINLESYNPKNEIKIGLFLTDILKRRNDVIGHTKTRRSLSPYKFSNNIFIRKSNNLNEYNEAILHELDHSNQSPIERGYNSKLKNMVNQLGKTGVYYADPIEIKTRMRKINVILEHLNIEPNNENVKSFLNKWKTPFIKYKLPNDLIPMLELQDTYPEYKKELLRWQPYSTNMYGKEDNEDYYKV